MRLDLLAYYAKNFGFEIDRKDLGKQRAFVDLAQQYVGVKGTINSFKTLLRSYGVMCDVSELYFTSFRYGARTDGDFLTTAHDKTVTQTRIVVTPAISGGSIEAGKSYISGDPAWYTDNYSPYGKQLIVVSGASVTEDNGEFEIIYAAVDDVPSTNTKIYVAHTFSSTESISVVFKDPVRQWITKNAFTGLKSPGTMWIGDKLNICQSLFTVPGTISFTLGSH
jgi:hypothetical protein